MHTTNYQNTLIAIAPDSSATAGVEPKAKANPTIALLTFQLISEHPYRFTSDDVLFQVYAERQNIPESERPAARAAFFAEPKACLRCSDLGKKYGWGIHSDGEGRVALYGVETETYRALASGAPADGQPVKLTRAMRSGK